MTDKFDHDKKGAGIAPAPSSHPAAISHSHAKPGGIAPASVAALSKQLQEGIHAYLNSEAYKELLRVMSRFHRYSLNNSILIGLQTGGKASQVASFTTWKALGRSVNKGEKGIKIFSPLPYKRQLEAIRTDSTGSPVLDADGNPVIEPAETVRIGFKVSYVFDISQTSRKALPEVVHELDDSVNNYSDLQTAIREACPVSVVFGPIEGPALGYYSSKEREVRIREGMSELQSLKTMIHETAHARLHAAGTAGAAFSREDKEIQAESVAFIVSSHYGLDTSEYSFPYVASWSSGDEKQLMTNLQVIKDASDGIIHSMDQSLERISLERQEQAVYKYPEGFLSFQRISDGTWQYERFGTDYLPKLSGSIPQAGLRIDQAATKAAFQLGYTGTMQQTDPYDFLYRKEIAQIEHNFCHIRR